MLKDTNYVVIPAWAINHLELNPTELIVYSVILGFSQDGESEFKGSVRYLSEATRTSVRTIHNALKSLVDKGCIRKTEHYENGVSLPRYSDCISHKFHWVCNPCMGGTADFADHNTNTYTSSSIKEEKKNPPSMSCGNASGDSDTNEEMLIDTKNDSTRKCSESIPSVADCVAYSKHMNFIINPYFFHSYFTSMGWSDSKGNKVKNWKLKMKTWNASAVSQGKAPWDGVSRGKSHQTESDAEQVAQIADARRRNEEADNGIF